jgi:hypothetical protein
MSANTTGTKPGLTPQAEEKPTIFSLRCKNTGCDSMEATEIKVEGFAHVGHRVYTCVKCGYTTSLAVGGPFVI